MTNPVNERFIQAFHYLQDRGEVTSQREFAQALDFPEQHFAGYRSGRRNLQLKHLTNLFNIYGVNLNWMVSGKGAMMEQENKKQKPLQPQELDLQKRLEIAEAKNALLEREREQHLKDIAYYKELLKERLK